MVQLVDTIVYTTIDQEGRARRLARRAAPPVWLMHSARFNSVHEVILGERLEAAVVGSTLWFGTTDSLRWARKDVAGDELELVRLRTNRRAANAEDIQRVRLRRKEDADTLGLLVDFFGGAQLRGLVDAHNDAVDQVPASEFLPAYDAMIAGSDHALWVRESASVSDDTVNWLLLTSQGVPLGRLPLPTGGEPLAGSSNVLVMKDKDELGVEYVRVLDIRRAKNERR